MVSLVIGITWGVAVVLLAFGSNVKPGITTLAIALAGVGLVLKTITIYTLGG